jgi:hypothetical protein
VILKTNPAIAASIENTIENVTLRNAAEIINANVNTILIFLERRQWKE